MEQSGQEISKENSSCMIIVTSIPLYRGLHCPLVFLECSYPLPVNDITPSLSIRTPYFRLRIFFPKYTRHGITIVSNHPIPIPTTATSRPEKMPPTTPHPNNKHKSSAMTNSQKGKSTAQTSTKSKTTLLNGETEPPTRKFGNQALSYEEREERDRTVAMLRSWEMCAVMGEEDAEVGVLFFSDLVHTTDICIEFFRRMGARNGPCFCLDILLSSYPFLSIFSLQKTRKEKRKEGEKKEKKR